MAREVNVTEEVITVEINIANQHTSINDLNWEMRINSLPIIIIIGLIAVVGIIGNCIVIYIYSNKYPKCNFKYFVLLLAGLDLLSCCILMPLEIVTLLFWFIFPSTALCKVKSFFNAFTVTSSATSLLLIAIDRYRKVCKPHSRQMTQTCAIKLSALVLALSAVPATSDAVFWGLHTFEMADSNVTAIMCEKDDAFKDTIIPTLHTAVLYAGTNMVVMGATIVLYILVASKLFCTLKPHTPSTPEIMVSPSAPDTGQSEQVFKFGSDIESGLSESEECSSRKNSLDTLDDPKEETADRNSNSIPPNDEVILRTKSVNSAADRSSQSKAVRLSLEFLEEDAKLSNNLRVPESPMRRKQSTTKASKSPKYTYGRRRSTVGSLRGVSSLRLRRKTLIMFILTAIFVATTFLYFCLISIMSHKSNLFNTFTFPERTAWLFFLRLYFVNSVINPILYGFLDPRFKRSLWNMGVRIRWLAGSLKKNLSVRVTRDELNNQNIQIRLPTRSRPLSSATMSD